MPTPEKLATDATVAIMLADGFEEVEALAVADVLYRAGVRSDLISVTDARHVTSSHGIRVVADLMLEHVCSIDRTDSRTVYRIFCYSVYNAESEL